MLTVSLYLRDLAEQAYRNTLKTTPDITWIEYKAIMLKVYKQINTQASVFQQLENLKHTNNIHVYTEKFLYLINQAEAAPEIQVYFYCKNLNTNVKKEIIYRKTSANIGTNYHQSGNINSSIFRCNTPRDEEASKQQEPKLEVPFIAYQFHY